MCSGGGSVAVHEFDLGLIEVHEGLPLRESNLKTGAGDVKIELNVALHVRRDVVGHRKRQHKVDLDAEAVEEGDLRVDLDGI